MVRRKLRFLLSICCQKDFFQAAAFFLARGSKWALEFLGVAGAGDKTLILRPPLLLKNPAPFRGESL